MKESRGKLDETLAIMFSNPEFSNTYLFYAHMLGQCSIRIREDLPAAAGVAYNVDHYDLFIRLESEWLPKADLNIIDETKIPKDSIKIENGVELIRTIQGFDDYPLLNRLAILKHEMLHILYGHVERSETRLLKPWNYATDCAENQQIDKDHLHESWITPKTLGNMYGIKIPNNKSAEEYYELIKSEEKKNNENSSDLNPSDMKPSGTHTTWAESKGDKDLQADLTKKMIEKSSTETLKGKGTLPNQFSEWLTFFTRKSEVNWKKVLRGIVGNKKVNNRLTIMRRDRRFPHREDLRGKTKDRTFNLLLIGDVSGSMSTDAILRTFGEVRHICDVTKTDVDLIQIDTQAYPPEKLTKRTKLIERKGHGGTELFPAIELAKKHNIDFQAVVVMTDGGLFGDDIKNFSSLKKKIIWLISPDGRILPEMNAKRMKAFKLKP